MILLLITVLFVLVDQPAYAYVGPGLGAGTIGTVLGIIGSVLLALFAVIYYPIKRALKKWKERKSAKESATSEKFDA